MPPIAWALRERFRQGYTRADFRADVLAGVVVGVVALPLSMALAIAVNAPPQAGLYTAIVAGLVVGPLGGSRFQVSGPTAAFVVVLAPIVSRHGLAGLLTAGVLAGGLMALMGLARLGKLIQFIPHPVTTGFTSGIAVVIATLQLKDVLGLRLAHMPDEYVARIVALWHAHGTFRPAELVIATLTLTLLLTVPRMTRRVPAPLVALTAVAIVAWVLHRIFPAFDAATINSRFAAQGGIPHMLPRPRLPWAGHPGGLTWSLIRDLMPSAMAIAMLGAIESLLSAVIADGMTRTRHDPDAELLAIGTGNMIAPLLGGIAATGALARTATNVRSGAQSPIASVVHALVLLLSMVVLARWVGYLPMASLAALMLVVAWNMSEVRHFGHILQVAPRSDVIVMLACFGLTVLVDMVAAVSIGVVLAALLFMRRMAEITSARVSTDQPSAKGGKLPKGVMIYEIAGALFFGATQNAMQALDVIHDNVRVVLFDLSMVPAMDATGLVGLESALDRLAESQVRAAFVGLQTQPLRTIERAKLLERSEVLGAFATVDEAVLAAEEHLVTNPRPSRPSVPVPSGAPASIDPGPLDSHQG